MRCVFLLFNITGYPVSPRVALFNCRVPCTQFKQWSPRSFCLSCGLRRTFRLVNILDFRNCLLCLFRRRPLLVLFYLIASHLGFISDTDTMAVPGGQWDLQEAITELWTATRTATTPLVLYLDKIDRPSTSITTRSSSNQRSGDVTVYNLRVVEGTKVIVSRPRVICLPRSASGTLTPR